MENETAVQLLRELLKETREQAARQESFGHFLNAQNTEAAKVAVRMQSFAEQLEHFSDQQERFQNHAERIAVLEAKIAEQKDLEKRLAEQKQMIIGAFLTLAGVLVAVVAIFAQFVRIK